MSIERRLIPGWNWNYARTCLTISKVTLAKWLALIVVLLLQIFTVVVLNNTERFYVERGQLLLDAEFLHGEQFWQESGTGNFQLNGGAITLYNDQPSYYSIFQTVPIKSAGHYSVSFDTATKDVKPSAVNKGGADVAVIHRNKLGSKSGHVKGLFAATGTRSFGPHTQTFYLGSEVGSVDLTLRLNSATGRFTLSGLTMSQLQKFPAYKAVETGVIVLWGIIIASFLLVVVRSLSRIQSLVSAATLIVALIGVLLPEVPITTLNRFVETLIPSAILGLGVSSIGHFFVFLALGAIAGANFRKIGIFFSISMLASFASLTEVLQLLVVGRTPSLNDFGVDLGAGFAGLLAGILVYLFFVGGENYGRVQPKRTRLKNKEIMCFSSKIQEDMRTKDISRNTT